MFFGKKHFVEQFGDQAEFIAQAANDIIDKYGYVLTGRLYSDGSCADFSTDQELTDTHVCVGIGMELMGTLPDREEPIQITPPNRESEIKALRARNAQLERMKNNGSK